MPLSSSQQTIHRFAWATLWYNIGVILWGAFVRATGAGAGCGSHWPDCNGEVIPTTDSSHTWIEFAHRLTTGLDGLLILGLLVAVFKHWPKGSLARRGVVLTMVFLLIEAAIGAALVKFELTADNPRPERAWVVGIHLVNTFFLLAALCATCWWTGGGAQLRPKDRPAQTRFILFCMAMVCVLAASGAVNALGDSLFPSESLIEGIQQDRSATAHIFIKLRVWHPAIAIITGILCIVLASDCRQKVHQLRVSVWATRLQGLIGFQLAFGFLNLLLLAPVWAQIVHLLLADFIWISLVFLSFEVWTAPIIADGGNVSRVGQEG